MKNKRQLLKESRVLKESEKLTATDVVMELYDRFPELEFLDERDLGDNKVKLIFEVPAGMSSDKRKEVGAFLTAGGVDYRFGYDRLRVVADEDEEYSFKKYSATSYYGSRSGIEDGIETDDLSELQGWCWEKLNAGNYVEVKERDRADELFFDPDVDLPQDDDYFSGVFEDQWNEFFSKSESLKESDSRSDKLYGVITDTLDAMDNIDSHKEPQAKKNLNKVETKIDDVQKTLKDESLKDGSRKYSLEDLAYDIFYFWYNYDTYGITDTFEGGTFDEEADKYAENMYSMLVDNPDDVISQFEDILQDEEGELEMYPDDDYIDHTKENIRKIKSLIKRIKTLTSKNESINESATRRMTATITKDGQKIMSVDFDDIDGAIDIIWDQMYEGCDVLVVDNTTGNKIRFSPDEILDGYDMLKYHLECAIPDPAYEDESLSEDISLEDNELSQAERTVKGAELLRGIDDEEDAIAYYDKAIEKPYFSRKEKDALKEIRKDEKDHKKILKNMESGKGSLKDESLKESRYNDKLTIKRWRDIIIYGVDDSGMTLASMERIAKIKAKETGNNQVIYLDPDGNFYWHTTYAPADNWTKQESGIIPIEIVIVDESGNTTIKKDPRVQKIIDDKNMERRIFGDEDESLKEYFDHEKSIDYCGHKIQFNDGVFTVHTIDGDDEKFDSVEDAERFIDRQKDESLKEGKEKRGQIMGRKSLAKILSRELHKDIKDVEDLIEKDGVEKVTKFTDTKAKYLGYDRFQVFRESLKEDWVHFQFKSGANPYIATTEKEKNRILKKYGKKVKEIKKGFYEVDDTEDESLKESYLDCGTENCGYVDELGYSAAVEYGDGVNQGKVFADETTLKQIQRDLIDNYGVECKIINEGQLTNKKNPGKEITRYSDVYDDETRNNGWWYFTTHGVQPGSVPKGVNILDTKDTPNGTYFKLDAILNTDELKEYDIKERFPKDESLSEDCTGFDCDDNQFYTREELDEIMYDVNDRLPKWVQITGAYADGNILDLDIDISEFGDDRVYVKTDFRKFKGGMRSGLEKVKDQVYQEVLRRGKSNFYADETELGDRNIYDTLAGLNNHQIDDLADHGAFIMGKNESLKESDETSFVVKRDDKEQFTYGTLQDAKRGILQDKAGDAEYYPGETHTYEIFKKSNGKLVPVNESLKESAEKVFHNSNGKDYEIIKSGKDEGGVPCLLLKDNKKNEYIAAWNAEENGSSWGQGHYFMTREDAEDYFNSNYNESFSKPAKINIRESLNKIDWDTDNRYDLRNMYDSSILTESQKRNIAKMISENKSPRELYGELKKLFEQ